MEIQAIAAQGAQQQAPQAPISSPGDSPAPAPASAPAATGIAGNAGVPGSEKGHTLSAAIAKLFSPPDVSQKVELQISYRVAKSPDEIITVITDPSTGKEIAQFPAEIMVQIAQFFDKLNGATVDHTA